MVSSEIMLGKVLNQPNKASKSCKKGLKLGTSQGTQTMAMQNMKQMASIIQNSPRSCQNEPKTCKNQSQNKLEQRAESMRHARLQKRCYTTPIKTKHGMT